MQFHAICRKKLGICAGFVLKFAEILCSIVDVHFLRHLYTPIVLIRTDHTLFMRRIIFVKWWAKKCLSFVVTLLGIWLRFIFAVLQHSPFATALIFWHLHLWSEPETHTKRRATRHGCLSRLLGDGDRRTEIVNGEEKKPQRTNQGRTPFICTLWALIHLSFNSQQGSSLSSLSEARAEHLSIDATSAFTPQQSRLLP